ncbi:MAG TPA: hypothetical protein VHW00_21155 [Thermoanaerobaculia bacterium]|nr:hypothetical protein [Thermoanaerobaculia bacterium]
MRKRTVTLLAIVIATTTFAQTRETTRSGTYVSDASGRVIRLEGRDGVVATSLYDAETSTQQTGLAVRVRDGVTLTVRYDNRGGYAVEGLPALTAVVDHKERTASVHADGKAVALLQFSETDLIDAVTLPGRLVWKVSAPDASAGVQQTIATPSGRTIASATLRGGIAPDAQNSGAFYDVAAADLLVDADADADPGAGVANVTTYEQSPTGAVTTARDANGRALFYIVHADRCDVGFSNDGKARFYDLELSPFAGSIAPGSDLVDSPSWEAQRAIVPDHLVITASGATALYIEEPARGGIRAAWVDGEGKVHAER